MIVCHDGMTPEQHLRLAILGDELEDPKAGHRRARTPKAAHGRDKAVRSGGMTFLQKLALKVVVLGLSLAASRMLFNIQSR